MLAKLKLGSFLLICFTITSCSKITGSSVTSSGTAKSIPTDQIQSTISSNTQVPPVYQLSNQDTAQLKSLNLVSDNEAAMINQYLVQ